MGAPSKFVPRAAGAGLALLTQNYQQRMLAILFFETKLPLSVSAAGNNSGLHFGGAGGGAAVRGWLLLGAGWLPACAGSSSWSVRRVRPATCPPFAVLQLCKC